MRSIATILACGQSCVAHEARLPGAASALSVRARERGSRGGTSCCHQVSVAAGGIEEEPLQVTAPLWEIGSRSALERAKTKYWRRVFPSCQDLRVNFLIRFLGSEQPQVVSVTTVVERRGWWVLMADVTQRSV